MNRIQKSLALVAAMISGSGISLAAEEKEEEAASDVTLAQDLTAVLALQGKPCGRVVNAARQGEDDYLATCENGDRYRIFVNEDGRVIVEKLG